MVNNVSRKARRVKSVDIKDFKRFLIKRKKQEKLKENIKELFLILFSASSFYIFVWLFYAFCYVYNLG